MAEKPKLKYRVVNGRNPKTGGVIKRPSIVDRETIYMDQLVNYAINAGYVRGQFHDMRGALNGFVEAMQQLGKDGKAVNLNNWLRIHAELTGVVGDSYKLTEANELHVAITALTDLKAKASDFSWTRVDDNGVVIKVESISSPNGVKDEIIKTKAIVATGRNLAYDATWNDKVTADWMEGTVAKTAELVPTEQSASYLRFDWPAAMSDITDGTEVLFNFRLHGSAGGAEQPSPRTAVVKVVAPPPPTITKAYPSVKPDELDKLVNTGDNVIEGTNLLGATVYHDSIDPENELATTQVGTATKIVFEGCGKTAGTSFPIIVVTNGGNAQRTVTAMNPPNPTLTKVWPTNLGEENAGYMEGDDQPNEVTGVNLADATKLVFNYRDGETEYNDETTIVTKTATQITFKLPGTTLAGIDGNLIVTTPYGTHTSSFVCQKLEG